MCNTMELAATVTPKQLCNISKDIAAPNLTKLMCNMLEDAAARRVDAVSH